MVVTKSNYKLAKSLGFNGTSRAWDDFVVSQNRIDPKNDRIKISIKNHKVKVTFRDYNGFDWNSTSTGSFHDAVKEARTCITQNRNKSTTTLTFRIKSNNRFYTEFVVPNMVDDVISKSAKLADDIVCRDKIKQIGIYNGTLIFEIILNILQHNYRVLSDIEDSAICNIHHIVKETFNTKVTKLHEGIELIESPSFGWYGENFDEDKLREYLGYCNKGPFYIDICRVSKTKEKEIRDRVNKITREYGIETIVEVHNKSI